MSAVALSRGFDYGVFGGGKPIELRMEDFLIVFLVILFIFNLAQKKQWKLEKPPALNSIIVWLSLLLLFTLPNLIFGRVPFDRAFFYYGKEVEFFVIYFYVFWNIKNIKSAKFLLNIFLLLGIINAGYVVYQATIGQGAGEYGAAAIAEKGVFPTGAFFMFFSIFSVNLFFHYYRYLRIGFFLKLFLAVLLISPVLGLIGSDSKTNFLAFIFAFALIIFFLLLKEKSAKSILIILVFLICFAAIFLFALDKIPYATRLMHILNPFNIIPNFQTGRMVIISPLLEEISKYPSMAILGFGTGFIGEAHNQFLRNYIEGGIIESIIFFMLIFAILRTSFKGFFATKDRFVAGMSSSLFISTMALLFTGLATDIFFVVKPMEVYWIFAALALATIKFSTPKRDNTAPILVQEKNQADFPQKNNISAIIVAHDPPLDFAENLKITSGQVAKVVVIDNGSSKINQGNFHLISNKENLGQGAALNQGVNWAKENGYKWVLLLDQDSRLDSKMVQNQIEAFKECGFRNKLAIIGVNCVFKGTGEIKYSLQNQKQYFEREVAMASGALLSLDAFLKTGRFREEFFIDSIDADYCLRLRKNGFKIIIAKNAMMEQRVGSNGRMKKFLWRKILVTNHSAKRCYYMTRNGLILLKEYFFSEPYWCFRRVVWYFLIKPLFVIFYEEDKKNKIKSMFWGAADALLNKTGK